MIPAIGGVFANPSYLERQGYGRSTETDDILGRE